MNGYSTGSGPTFFLTMKHKFLYNLKDSSFPTWSTGFRTIRKCSRKKNCSHGCFEIQTRKGQQTTVQKLEKYGLKTKTNHHMHETGQSIHRRWVRYIPQGSPKPTIYLPHLNLLGIKAIQELKYHYIQWTPILRRHERTNQWIEVFQTDKCK